MAEETGIDRSRLLIPGLGGLYGSLSPLSYAIMRFSAGAIMVPHGVQKLLYGSIARSAEGIAAKGIPFATFLAGATVFTELVAAICLAIGLFTRAAAVMIWIEMTVIILFFNWQFGYFWTNRGIEFALLWWLLCFAIFFRGGGRYSLDRFLGKEI